jgi:hypothetical protein
MFLACTGGVAPAGGHLALHFVQQELRGATPVSASSSAVSSSSYSASSICAPVKTCGDAGAGLAQAGAELVHPALPLGRHRDRRRHRDFHRRHQGAADQARHRWAPAGWPSAPAPRRMCAARARRRAPAQAWPPALEPVRRGRGGVTGAAAGAGAGVAAGFFRKKLNI